MQHRQPWMLVGLMTLALAACGTEQTPSTNLSPTSASATDQPAVAGAANINPLCNLATLAEVQAVTGGTVTGVEGQQVEDLAGLSCYYANTQLTNVLEIEFTTTARLVKLNSQWQTADAYFAEWTRKAEPVAGVGEKAAWVDITKSLWVLKGDTVVEFNTFDTFDDRAVRTKFETLAQQTVARLP